MSKHHKHVSSYKYKELLIVLTFNIPTFFVSSSLAANVHVGIKYSFKTAHSTIPTNQRDCVYELSDLINEVQPEDLLISGHTDWIASDEINQELSEGRAFNTRLILQKKSKTVNIAIKGFGKYAPVADNSTEDGRAKNRRVVTSFINMNDYQKNYIVRFVEQSKYLYIVAVENEKVEEEIISSQQSEAIESNDQVEILIQPEIQTAPLDAFEPLPGEQTLAKATSEYSNQPINRFSLGLKIYQSVIDSADIIGVGSGVDAKWVSRINTGFKANYQRRFSQRIWFGAQIGIDRQSYFDQINPMFNWDKQTPFVFNTSVLVDYESTKWGIGISLDIYEDIILREEALNLTFDKVMLYGLTLESQYYPFSTTSSDLGLEVDFILPLASSENFGGLDDFGFNVAALFKTRFLLGGKNREWLFKVFYKQTTYSVNESNQRNSSAGLEVSLSNLNWL